ncbi:MAG: SsrA-binding protein SmpB [Deltaproteobacteria bacterium]|nr:MAG: SsrA-binding protein SmpB [Deltaproteobacteria bacterium]
MAKRRQRNAAADHADGHKVLVRNKKARHDYAIEETYEAGISLVGSEVKSLRESMASLTDAYAVIRGGEAYLVGARINEYPWANQFNHDPTRDRKLLLHKHEIRRLAVKTAQRGYALVPLAMYLKDGKIKVELGLGVGKRLYEKREAKREAEDRREIERAIKRR